MKQFIISFLLVFILLSCDRTIPENKVLHHVIKGTVVDSTGSITLFYGHHNFIVSTNGNTYYHNKLKEYGIGHGIDFTKPSFLDLKPSDLQVLTDESIDSFVNSTVPEVNSSQNKVLVSISSPTDSVYNKHFKIIQDILNQKGVNYYSIRKTTEEELAVLMVKVSNSSYNSDSIDWKEGFGGLKFLPPKN